MRARMRGGAISGALLLAATSVAGQAAPPTLDLPYEVTFGGVTVMRFQLAEHADDGRYHIDFSGQTVGVANWVFRSTVSASTDGRLDGTLPRPDRYASDSTGKSPRRTRVSYHADGTVETEADPVPAAEPDGPLTPIVPDSLPGTIDPLSGLLALAGTEAAAGGCAGTVRIYDGRRRYDLVLHPPSPGEIDDPSDPAAAAGAVRCALHLVPLGGYPVDPKKRISDNDATLWIAERMPDGPKVPIEIAFKSHWGVLRVRLVRDLAKAG